MMTARCEPASVFARHRISVGSSLLCWKNGIKVTYIPMEHSLGFSRRFMTPIGSRCEKPGQYGISHFVEHMNNCVTAKFPSVLERKRYIDSLGGVTNASTSHEYTDYFITVPAEHADLAIEVSAVQLFGANFLPHIVEAQRGTIFHEMALRDQGLSLRCAELMTSLMYQGSSMEHPVIGSPQSICAISVDDLLAYRANAYRTSLIQVYCAGNITPQNKETLERSFGQQKSEGDVVLSYEHAPFGKGRVAVEKHEIDLVFLQVGFPGIKFNSKDEATLRIMNKILGGGVGSRLGATIRERDDLTYHIESEDYTLSDTGYQLIATSTKLENLGTIMRRIREELERFVAGIEADELDSAKHSLIGSYRLGMETPGAVAEQYQCLRFRNSDQIISQNVLELLRGVTVEDVNLMASKIFKLEQARIALIGKVSPESVSF